MTELEKIIEIHENLIYKLTNQFHEVPKEDLYQAGVIGLIKAYNNYIPNNQTKFTTYAYKYIYGEMYETANKSHAIKLNKNILKLYKKIEQAKNHLTQVLGHLPSLPEISNFLNVDEQTILGIYENTQNIMSLDSDNQEEYSLYEKIPSKDYHTDTLLDINESIKRLSKEEQQIIKYRYYNDLTQSETAKALGITQVKVSRSEKKCLTKMYNYLSN